MRKKMLVVEDEKIDALSIGRVLKQYFPDVGLEVVTNGEQALDWIQRFRADPDAPFLLILMDLTMPRMSGLDLISEFRNHSNLKTVPIVILSGTDSPEAVKSAYGSGACGYVVKSETAGEMRGVLKKTLDFWLEANRLPTS